jgi:FixJ family two-component response regulator
LLVNEAANRLISIVDDDESIREATSSLLKSHGLKAQSFSSAEAFLSSTQLQETACLLLDIRMPGMNGLELQRQLIAENLRIPIIFITAPRNQGLRNEAMQAGAVGFLTKPFNEEALLDALLAALRKPNDGES